MRVSPLKISPLQPMLVNKGPDFSEWAWVLVLLVGLFVAQVATYRWYPAVWCDEVSFSEPAINFVKHGSFTTLVWQHQPPDTFPAINCPLYSMSLVPWLSIFGTNLLAIRSFNFALMGVAAFLIWLISWRYKLVESRTWRILLPILLFSGYGLSFAYRCSRPDVLALVCLCLLSLAPTLERTWKKNGIVILLGALCVWVGLQVALYAALFAFFAWAVLRVITIHFLVVLAAGFLVGAVTLAGFLKAHGVLQYLLPIITGMSGKHYAHEQSFSLWDALRKVVKKTFLAYPDDFSMVFLAAAVLMLLPFCWRKLDPARRRWVMASLVLVAAVPAVFNLIGHYAFYYSYMLFVPIALSFTVVGSHIFTAAPAEGLWKRITVLIALSSAIGIGLPFRLALTFAFTHFDSPARIHGIVSTHLRPSDVVFSEYISFFYVKRSVHQVYDPWSSSETMPFHIPGRAFTEQEKSDVSALVIRPEQVEKFAEIFPGSWVPAGPAFGDSSDKAAMRKVPGFGGWLVRHFSQPQMNRFQVQIFRRAEASSP